jgi:hypothetical protein
MDGEHPAPESQSRAANTFPRPTVAPAEATEPAPATSEQLRQAERKIEERMTEFERSSI